MVMVIPPYPGGAGDIVATRLRTKLSLWEWARIMGLNPLHFFGLEFLEDANRSAQCRRPWFEYAWQSADRISREDVSRCIAEAEGQIEAALGFRLLPSWEWNEEKPLATPANPALYRLGARDIRGQGMTVNLDWGYFVAGGIMGIELIEADATVSYDDADGDGYAETATITVSSALTADPAEIAVTVNSVGYYDDALRVRPIQRIVTTDLGGGITQFVITCRREQFVKWEKYTIVGPEAALEADDADNFVEVVDVWRRFNDTTTQAMLNWESPNRCCDGSASCTVCGFVNQGGCIVEHNARLGIVSFRSGAFDDDAVFTPAAMSVGRAPDSLHANYRAGLIDRTRQWTPTTVRPFTDNAMDKLGFDWAQVVAHFAAAKLDRPVCDCGYTQQVLERYNEDLAYSSGAEQTATYSLSASDLKNPFGTRRGAVEAWHAVVRDGLGRVA